MGREPHYDYLIADARVVDGTGSPWYRASVAITADRIVAIGPLDRARAGQVLEAADRYLAPGFIDAHVHADLALLAEPTLEAGMRQGVTGHVIGQDGISYAPSGDETASAMHAYFAAVNGTLAPPPGGMSVASFLDRFDRTTAANVAYLVPHGAVRLEAVGPDDREPSAAELAHMCDLVSAGIADGAVGVSTGLDYIPCRYAATAELTALAAAAGRAGGVFVAHMRGYGPRVHAGMAEMCQVARDAAAPVHVSHYNVPADDGLALIDQARAEGLDVTYDLYPYLAGSSTLMLWLPPDLHVGTVASMLDRLRTEAGRARVVSWFDSGEGRPLAGVRFSHLALPEHGRYLGMTPQQGAEAAGRTLGEFLYDLLVREELRPGVVAFDDGWRTEADLRRLMSHPAHMVGSDGIYVGARPHPRGWGTFARTLATYVRDDRVLALEDAVRRMTSFPARRFGMVHRGRIAPAAYADLVLFGLDAVHEHATFERGRALASGITTVFVNGEPVLWDGVVTGALPGRPIRGPGGAMRA